MRTLKEIRVDLDFVEDNFKSHNTKKKLVEILRHQLLTELLAAQIATFCRD